MFISTKHLYPYEHEHKWAFGDLPQTIIESLKTNPFMRDIHTEATPFEITEEGLIKYHRSFKNIEQYQPQFLKGGEQDKMRELTSYGATNLNDKD